MTFRASRGPNFVFERSDLRLVARRNLQPQKTCGSRRVALVIRYSAGGFPAEGPQGRCSDRMSASSASNWRG
jgi:hypothetical protein